MGPGSGRGLRTPRSDRDALRGLRGPGGRHRRHRRTTPPAARGPLTGPAGCGSLRGDGRPAHPRSRRSRALSDPLLPGVRAGRRAAPAHRHRDGHPGRHERGDRAGHAPADPGLRCPGGPGHPRPRRDPVARDGLAVRALRRRDEGPAHAGRVPPRAGADRPDPRGDRALPHCHDGHAQARLRLLGHPRADRHPVGGPGRGHRRRPPCRRAPRPAHRPGRPAARPRGLLAAAPRGRGVPRRRRRGRDVREGRRPADLAGRRRPCRTRAPTATWSSTGHRHLPGSGPAGPRRPVRDDPAHRHHRRHRPVRRRQVHPAVRPLRSTRPRLGTAAGRRGAGRRRGLARPRRTPAATAGLRRRHHRRQRAARLTGRLRRRDLGRAPPGRPRGAGPAAARSASTLPSARTAPHSRPESGRGSPWPGSCSPSARS